ncbi:MAG: sodium:solute symporter [Acidobacteria bacterium]|nr:sodium:solute symporter [Acidobacteriota bacterium]
MRLLDWVVLIFSLVVIVGYGLYKSRGKQTIRDYILAGKSMPWWAMGLSIMATQASAITFIGTTGQAYVDGMRFVQFYFGLPLAMVILSATVVPFFHRARVVTAYEFLEQRFDAKTRVAASIVFLIQRGLGVGLALYAPAVVLSVIFGWSERATVLIMAGIVLSYAVPGGVKAVTWTDVQQMMLIFLGVFAAFLTAIYLMPSSVSFGDALYLAGVSGKLNAVDLSFDLQNRYNLWSGLIGGMFLALSYFGCDQSQVQRYLTGKSIAHSRVSLLFNAFMKVPLQFFILLTGALVFTFFLFEKPPMLFNRVEAAKIEQMASPEAKMEYEAARRKYDQALEQRTQAAHELLESRRNQTTSPASGSLEAFRQTDQAVVQARREGIDALQKASPGTAYDDTNYIFLTFVTRYFPVGLVGLVIAAIFAAAMSTISAELNALASTSVMDIYRRFINREAEDRHYVFAAKGATVFWGIYAGVFAFFGGRLGSLIEAVNMVGSLFYGSLLGVFVLAFGFPRATGTGTFIGLIAGEIAVLLTSRLTGISYLWYNVVGCVVVVIIGSLASEFVGKRKKLATHGGRA